MMVPAPATALATSPYASGVTTAALHPALPQLDPAYAAAAAANLQPPAKDTTWTKLFVGGLPYTTTDQELREFFEEFGEIEEAAVIIDRQTGKSKGYGFVTMADTKAAARAVQNPNPVIQGRKSNVNYAFIGAKHNSPRAVMTPEAYATAAATMHRYQTFLPPQYGASAAAGAMLYSAAPYSTVLPAAATAVPVPAAAASAAQAVLPAAGYGAPTAYDYGLTVPSSAVTAASQLPPQYFYQQMMDPSQYMTMASLQGTPLTSATHGAGTTVMPSMYQSIGPSVSVSAAVTSATPALPAPTPTALPAASYPAIQDQR